MSTLGRMLMDRPLVALLPDVVTARVVGRHRARFLHAMTTADVNRMTPGAAAFALMATSTGRHVGQMRLEVEGDAIVLTGRRGSIDAILEALAKHRVADDVRWQLEAATTTVAVYGTSGATARALVAAVLGPLDDLGAHAFVDRSVDGAPVRVVAVPAEASELAREAIILRTAPENGAHLRVRLLASGAEPLDEAGWERLRIEAGWPLDGVDVSPEDVALASERLGGTVSWTKGCFLGQEVYVMARDRGELPKRLRGVRIDRGEVPHRGELKDGEGRVAGLLGSAVATATGFVGLAMLKRKHCEAGTELQLADGRRAEVVALPLR